MTAGAPDSHIPEPNIRAMTLAEREEHFRKRAFLEAFRVNGIVASAFKAAEVKGNSLTVKKWAAADEWFRQEFDAASEDAADNLEHEAWRRAVEGVNEPVTFQGLPTYIIDAQSGEKSMFTIKRHSDSLLTTLLKARRPEKFRENVKTTHAVEAGGVLIVPAAVDPASWAKAVEEQQAQFAGNTGQEKAK